MTMTEQIEEKKKKRKLSRKQTAAILSKNLGVEVTVLEPSERLKEALKALHVDFEKLQPKVDRVFEIGRSEGFIDKEIGRFVRKEMDEHYNRRTITRVLESYPDAKNANMRREIGDKMSPNHICKCRKCGRVLEEEHVDEKTGEPDKYRFYKETIDTKNRLLKQKDEEIAGLKKQIEELIKKK